jgi:hypothetical protein
LELVTVILTPQLSQIGHPVMQKMSPSEFQRNHCQAAVWESLLSLVVLAADLTAWKVLLKEFQEAWILPWLDLEVWRLLAYLSPEWVPAQATDHMRQQGFRKQIERRGLSFS